MPGAKWRRVAPQKGLVRSVADRYVRDGKCASAAGVSAGIDVALALAIELSRLEAAERIQLAIEYDAAPSISAGDAERAPIALCEACREKLREREAQVGYSRFTLGRSGA